MRIIASTKFKKNFQKLSATQQKQVSKQLKYFSTNVAHPSLRLKKMQGVSKVWELRVNRGYRIKARKEENSWLLLEVGPHNVLDKK